MHIFIVCYNEAIMIPHTVAHYRSRFPSCQITILDNISTDSSVDIARSLGCNVIPFESSGSMNEFVLLNLRNNSWKNADDWVIVCDMDEWICLTEEQLKKEEEKGTTILKIKGYNMIADSQSEDLSDLDLQALSRGMFNPYECKNLCFDARKIKKMNYSLGAHHCLPEGPVKFSESEYILKHMDELGFPYKCYKNKIRFERSEMMRKQYNMLTHYVDDPSILRQTLDKLLIESYDIREFLSP